jgi:adenosylcobyric acid synthase
MLQGTGSDVGKSTLVAGLCRAFKHRGLEVRPFKPQNMSNNAAVTPNGGEIGRAQALQARACGVAPADDMNPVLLKPQTDVGSQVIVNGQIWGNADARDYQALKPRLLPKVLDSFERLRRQSDLVLVEGAGSAAEVNLRKGDIANMGFAVAADVPVALVADIDRGGVIASVVGTHALLSGAEQRLLCGYVVNRFRGDVTLFDGGIDIIGHRTGLPCFGVVPYLTEASRLPAEDSVAIGRNTAKQGNAPIRIAVPVLSRIANFNDLDPLIAEPDVDVVFIESGTPLPGAADVVILPGSKSTIADLQYMRDQGWDADLFAHLRRGGWVVGLCGGYQMLGRGIHDTLAIEGDHGSVAGLGLLDFETRLEGSKVLAERAGRELTTGQAVRGYEMHMGNSEGPATLKPMLDFSTHRDGAISDDGRVMGCYLHGLFDADDFRHDFLARIKDRHVSGVSYEASVEGALDALAAHMEAYLDMDAMLRIARAGAVSRARAPSSLATTRIAGQWQ